MINLGLLRPARLLALSPTPRTWKAVHIAGTNGKGSVAAYLSSLLRRLGKRKHEEGIRIGRFTSPHFIDRWDCITINDEPVSKSVFEAVEKDVTAWAKQVDSDLRHEYQAENTGNAVDDRGESLLTRPTEFELLTVTAFEIFSRAKVDIGIIECGLGGRLDATNILVPEDVVISVITRVGLDHQNFLGDTVAAIAREKAGICKAGVDVVVSGTNEREIVEAVTSVAKVTGAKQVDVCNASEVLGRWNIADSEAVTELMAHQKENLAMALTAVEKVRMLTSSSKMTEKVNINDPFEEDAVQLMKVVSSDVAKSYPGRIQWLSIESATAYKPFILVDGAHNPQSAQVLRDYVDKTIEKTGDQNTTWVLAMTQGKNANEILNIFMRKGDRLIACGFGPVEGMPWIKCMDPTKLAAVAVDIDKAGEEIQSATHILDALKHATTASQHVKDTQPPRIVVAGSLYLVSDLLLLSRDGSAAFESRWEERTRPMSP